MLNVIKGQKKREEEQAVYRHHLPTEQWIAGYKLESPWEFSKVLEFSPWSRLNQNLAGDAEAFKFLSKHFI